MNSRPIAPFLQWREQYNRPGKQIEPIALELHAILEEVRKKTTDAPMRRSVRHTVFEAIRSFFSGGRNARPALGR